MTDSKTFKMITDYLMTLIPKDEIDRKYKYMAEFSPDFAGFVDIYYYLSKVIPKDYTVIDFGAGYNAQSYFFTGHRKYIAINPATVEADNGMFCPENCTIYHMTTLEFLEKIDYPKENVFAICNYVPNWYGQDSIDLVHKNFRNCYTFFPDDTQTDCPNCPGVD